MDLNLISPLCTPDILKEAVLKIYLKKTGKKNIPEILNYTVNYAAGKGDGYLGIIYRITVNLEGDLIIKLIGKGMPTSLSRRETFKCAGFFDREVYFYTKIAPVFSEFEKKMRGDQFNESESLLHIPDCYYALSDGVNDFILMEDLIEDGYIMVDRSAPLSTERITSMVKTLARFHGFSVAFKAKNGEIFDKLIENVNELVVSEDRREWIEKYLLRLTEVFVRAIQDELKDTHYLQRFKEFIDPKTFYDKILSCGGKDKGCYVICHGDPWLTNFLFKNEKQVKAIDFQLVRIGSPMLDLSTMIFSCTTADARNKLGGLETIFDIYHVEVLDTVRTLGGSRHATIELTPYIERALWKKLGVHGLGCSMELVTLSLVESEDVADADQIPEGVVVNIEVFVKDIVIKKEESKKVMIEVVKLAVDENII